MSSQITFSDEQTMLLDTATEFCRKHSPIESVRARLDADQIDATTWKEITDLGWLGINVPEEFGGLGLGLSCVVPVAESMGRYLMGSPYNGAITASECLATSGSRGQREEWLPKIVSGAIGSMALIETNGSWVLDQIEAQAIAREDTFELSGAKCFVTDADAADFYIVSVNVQAKARLVLVKREQIPDGNLHRETVIDETRRSYQLDLDGITVPVDQLLEGSDFQAIEFASLLLLSAEITGGLVGSIHTIVEYLNTRRAFDKVIGSYQALKHPTVKILLDLEASRSHLYHAATVLADDNAGEAEIALRMAKAHGSAAFAFAGDRAVQFHGGFGFTYECDAQLYLRRALWCQYQFGDEAYHRQLLEPILLD
ncbi:acyl-CoA/acyl-ACP dehydrogenase [Gammaproteobacteria bacterium]|nr:acyl-CoA/acyl-ACP dehydrogenase [Gammaproteobacteria bacterium]